jgi:hypothetical protein
MASIRGRRGFGPRSLRAPLGGGASLAAPGAPTISASDTVPIIGGTLTIVAGAGAAPTSYRLYRDGVLSGTVVDGRRFVDLDVGSSLTVTAVNAAGESAASNALQFLPSSLSGCVLDQLADSDQITLASTKVTTWNDRSSQNNDTTQGTDANRPTIETINGKDAVRFTIAGATRLRKTSLTGLGGTSPELTQGYALQAVGNPATGYQMVMSLNAAVGWSDFWSTTSGRHDADLGAVEALQTEVDATDSLHRYVMRRSNASTNTVKNLRDGADEITATGTLTAMSSATPDFTMGTLDGGASFPLGAKVRSAFMFNKACSDAEVSNLDAYLAWTVRPSGTPWWSAPRVMRCGDSTCVGNNGGLEATWIGGSRPPMFAALTTAGLTCTPVGPYDNFGDHRGIAGESGFTVAADPAAFAAELLAHTPDIVILGWGINDMIAGSATGAQTITTFQTLTKIVKRTLPFAKVIWDSVIRWTGYAPGAAYLTECDAFNTAGPAAAAAANAYWCDVGAPARTDFVHPVDGPTGYDLVGAAESEAVLLAAGRGP